MSDLSMMKMRPSSSASSSREKFRRKSSKELLGSIAESPDPPLSPSIDASTVSSEDDDEDIDLAVRPLERRDRSFLNHSGRSLTKCRTSGFERSKSSSSSSIRLLDKSKRESSLLTPRQQEPPQPQSHLQHQTQSTKAFRKDDFASALAQLVTVTPKRSRSMVDGLRRKSSLRDELARKAITADEKSRRPRSFVETSSTGSIQRGWFQKSKSQVQLMVLGSFMSDVKLPLEIEKKPSRSPQRNAPILHTTPRSIMKTSSSSAASEHTLVADDLSRINAETNEHSVGKHHSISSPTKTLATVVSSKPKSPRNTSKSITTKDLKNEMDLLIHGEMKNLKDHDNDDHHDDNDLPVQDSAEDNSRSVKQHTRIKNARCRIHSISKSESSCSASSQCGHYGWNSDDDLSEISLARLSTPTTSNLRKTFTSSPASPLTKQKKIRSKPVGTLLENDGAAVSDEASVSSSSQHSLRPKLSRISRSSLIKKSSRSQVSVDMAGSFQSYPLSPRTLPLPEPPAVAAASPGIMRRRNKSFVGKDDFTAPTEPERSPQIPPIFNDAFYSSSHHRRTMATQSLIWTTDRQDNFSDWILLIIRAGVSWETSNVDTYHIHKSVVGVGPRPSLFLLDQFEDQDSVFVRNTSSVEMFSQAADLVPTMLDYIYGMRGESLHVTTATATALRFLADKFGVESMFREVNEFIQRDLNENTVDTYNSDAVLFKDKQLMQATFRLQKTLEVSK
jgi:hypothetical protein